MEPNSEVEFPTSENKRGVLWPGNMIIVSYFAYYMIG